MRFNLPGRKVKPGTAERDIMAEVEKHGKPTNEEVWCIHLLLIQARRIDKLEAKLTEHAQYHRDHRYSR